MKEKVKVSEIRKYHIITFPYPALKGETKIRLTINSTKHKFDKSNFIRDGYHFGKYKIGETFKMINEYKQTIFTSIPIVEIINENTFRTANSEYKIEYMKSIERDKLLNELGIK